MADVVRAVPELDRDEAIHAWCECVWNAYRDNRPVIIKLLEEYGI